MKRLTKLALLFLVLLFAIEKWDFRSFDPPMSSNSINSYEIKLMTYNFENLFDSKDDPKKNDETYLPINKKREKSVRDKCLKAKKPHWVRQCLNTNWTKLKIEKKMFRLSKVIKEYSPDILFVQEVENIDILNQLNKKHLGFKNAILLEGEDMRGIDVGILTNLKLIKKPKTHSQKTLNFKKNTRGILEAHVELPDGEPLGLYAVHLPSQGSPLKARKHGLKRLMDITKKSKGLKIVAGDFNITKEEESVYKKTLSNSWQVSHKIGCSNCKGTYYYHPKRAWSFFDVFLFSKEFKKDSKWSIDLDSIKVFNPLDIQNSKFKTPARFNDGNQRNGVSDHWPLVATIKKS